MWPAIAGAGLTLAIPPLTLAVLDSLHGRLSAATRRHDPDCRAQGLIGYYADALASARPVALASR